MAHDMRNTPATNRRATCAVLAVLGMSLAACHTHASTPASPPASASASSSVASRTPSSPAGNTASLVLLNPADRTRLQGSRAAMAALMAQCDAHLDYTPTPLADLNAGRHYTSTGANPASKPHTVLSGDSGMAYQQALCHMVTGQAKYAATAQRIIDAWSSTLTSASTISGQNEIAFDMTPMTVAASWVRGVGGWTGDHYAQLLRTVTLPATEAVMAHQHNHGLWGVLFQASAAVFLDDHALLTTTRQRWQVLMGQEVDAHGVMTHETERSDTSDYTGGPDKGRKGLAYTHYALLPASVAAKIFADQGMAVWQTPGGVLLGRAFATAAGWTLHPSTFPYYASNHGHLDGVRSASYFSLLQAHYPNADAAAVLRQGNITSDTFRLLQIFPAS